MNLHEYQAKELFTRYGMQVPAGEVAANAEEAVVVAQKLAKSHNCDAWVIKAQVHAGGRGKGGGVKFATSLEEVAAATVGMLGRRLVTYQTDAKGLPVHQVLVAEPTDIARELYLGAVVDRASQRVVMMASTEGGVDIEHVAEHNPEKILQVMIDPLVGLLPYQCREIGFALELNAEQIKHLTQIMLGLYRLFIEQDLSLVEINPLVVTKDGRLTCLDGKVNIDDNAMYRHPDLRELRDITQEDERENRAHNWELNYIALDGDIGCMVNGAGLAMATMDLIKLHGGNPANFLDVGGGATKERVTEAFKIILSDENVKGVLINIFGGIVRCDMIADGIMSAVADVGVTIPVVVRLEGNNAGLAAKMLADSGLNIIAASGFDDAARRIVAAVKHEER